MSSPLDLRASSLREQVLALRLVDEPFAAAQTWTGREGLPPNGLGGRKWGRQDTGVSHEKEKRVEGSGVSTGRYWVEAVASRCFRPSRVGWRHYAILDRPSYT